MKKIFTLFILTLTVQFAIGQNKLNVVIFSEDGEPFFAFVNGVKQNPSAETNVRITDLTAESFSFRIVFANSGNEPIVKNQFLPFGSEYTFKIKRDKKGVLVMKPFGQVELAQAPANNNSIVYHSTELPNNNTAATNTNNNNTTVTTTETVNVTTTNSNAGTNQNVNTGANGENVNMNINVGTNGMNMNVNVSGTGSNGNYSENVNMNVNGSETYNTSTNVNGTTTHTTTTTTTTSGNNYTENSNYNATNTSTTNAGNCFYPADQPSFEKMKTSIESKPFSDTKMSTAKQATKNNCLSTDQIKVIMELFSMDDDKLAYAKFAYDYCTDRKNYYTLGDVFSFSSSTDELNKFLETK